MSVTASKAHRRLFSLIEQVNDDQEAMEMVSQKGTAYLVPEHGYRSLRETAYLLAPPVNAERLRHSLTEVRGGPVAEHELRDDRLRDAPPARACSGSTA